MKFLTILTLTAAALGAYSCGQPTPTDKQPQISVSEPTAIVSSEPSRPTHPDSLWINDGFAWAKEADGLRLSLSAGFKLTAKNPTQVPNSNVYLLSSFEITFKNQPFFSYPQNPKNKPELVMEINLDEPKLPKLIKQSDKKLIVWKVFNPKQQPKSYQLQAISVEKDQFKAFLNPLTNELPTSLGRDDWRAIFEQAFDSN